MAAAQGPDDARAKEDALLEKAAAIRNLWANLSTAFNFPVPEPGRNKTQWDSLLQEGAWLAQDVMQERLWRQAVVYHLAHAAADPSRPKLRPTATVEKCDTSVLGKVKESKQPLYPDHITKSETAAAAAASATSNGIDASEDAVVVNIKSLFYTCTSEFQPAIIQQLEEEDIARLARHAEAKALYQVALDAARKTQQVVTLDDILGHPNKRKGRPGMLAVPGEEDGLDATGSPMRPGGIMSNRGRPGMAQPALGGRVDGMDIDGTGARDKRKRRNRDFANDEDYEPNKMGPNRERLPGGPMRPGMAPMPGMPGMPLDKKNLAAQKAAMGLKSPPGKAGMTRMDSVSKMGTDGMGRAAYAAGRLVTPGGPWTQQDDQLLIAIVTEFNQNWYLVSDVLRSASAMAGVTRRHEACKQRYSQLQRLYLMDENDPNQGQDLRPEQLAQPLMSKHQAKEVLALCMPVHESVLAHHVRTVSSMALRVAHKRQERMQQRQANQQRTGDHASHLKIQQAVLSECGGQFRTPVQYGTVMDQAVAEAVQRQTTIITRQQHHLEACSNPAGGGGSDPPPPVAPSPAPGALPPGAQGAQQQQQPPQQQPGQGAPQQPPVQPGQPPPSGGMGGAGGQPQAGQQGPGSGAGAAAPQLNGQQPGVNGAVPGGMQPPQQQQQQPAQAQPAQPGGQQEATHIGGFPISIFSKVNIPTGITLQQLVAAARSTEPQLISSQAQQARMALQADPNNPDAQRRWAKASALYYTLKAMHEYRRAVQAQQAAAQQQQQQQQPNAAALGGVGAPLPPQQQQQQQMQMGQGLPGGGGMPQMQGQPGLGLGGTGGYNPGGGMNGPQGGQFAMQQPQMGSSKQMMPGGMHGMPNQMGGPMQQQQQRGGQPGLPPAGNLGMGLGGAQAAGMQQQQQGRMPGMSLGGPLPQNAPPGMQQQQQGNWGRPGQQPGLSLMPPGMQPPPAQQQPYLGRPQ